MRLPAYFLIEMKEVGRGQSVCVCMLLLVLVLVLVLVVVLAGWDVCLPRPPSQ